VESYTEFLARKAQDDTNHGFEPVWMPDFLFDFQQALVEWAVRKGRAAIFSSCGSGKTPMQLAWAENVVRQTNGRVLIATPLAVSAQTIQEAEKFGVTAARSMDGRPHAGVTVTNYERLHHFNPSDYIGMVCDESSCLKSFDSARKAIITDFMRKMHYRLLCTATAAPNDYIELGTSSEALGYLGHTDMLTRFFKNAGNTIDQKGKWRGFGAPRAFERQQWRFKAHARPHFWRWVCSWARAIRQPSDLGFSDEKFILPPLIENEYIVEARTRADGMLFELPAIGLREEREEQRRTIQERCEKAAELVAGTGKPAILWCHLNAEGDRLAKILPEARQVSGSQSPEEKEEIFTAFAAGSLRLLIVKPKIAAWGLNWSHCAHMTMFPSHSFEQTFQSIRRCWRFGQKSPVVVDIVTTEGGREAKENLRRKGRAADEMFAELVFHMRDALHVARSRDYELPVEVPAWLA